MRQGILTFANSNGAIETLSPAQLQPIDPQHLGDSPTILSILNQYPVRKRAFRRYDGGLNFVGYRFNAPDNLTNNAYVGKMDFHLDQAGKQILSVRGSLAGNNQVLTPQSFPGEPTNNVQLNNSRGISALYTTLLSPSMVNVLAFGLTRIGLSQTGPSGTAFNLDSIDTPVNYTTAPIYAFRPPTTSTTISPGPEGRIPLRQALNIRFVRNGYTNYANAWPTYAFGRTIYGLGSDFLADVQSYLAANGMNSTIANTQALETAVSPCLASLPPAASTTPTGRTGLHSPSVYRESGISLPTNMRATSPIVGDKTRTNADLWTALRKRHAAMGNQWTRSRADIPPPELLGTAGSRSGGRYSVLSSFRMRSYRTAWSGRRTAEARLVYSRK